MGVIDSMKGRRGIVGFVSAVGKMEMTIGIIQDADSDFIKIKSISENAEPGIIQEGIISYIPTDNIDSIVDAQDEFVYKTIMDNLKNKHQQAMAQIQAKAKEKEAIAKQAASEAQE